MPAYHISRSILIKAPVQQIRESLCDFRQWPKWSPWLIMETDTQLNFNNKQGEVGASYDWKGNLAGEGKMTLTKISDHRLEMDLSFIKPFRSKAKVSFDLVMNGTDTDVSWNMDSKLPFFLFWMLKKIKTYISMDYERGLKMLKAYIEKGSVSSSIKIDGITKLPAQLYVGIANSCNLEDMPEVIPQDFRALSQFLQENNLPTDNTPFSIYNTFDILENNTQFISAVPVNNEDVVINPPFIIGHIEESKVLKVTHTGAYQHLGNAWSAAFNFAHHKKIKIKKIPKGIEYYLNDPRKTPDSELITEVVLLLK